MTDAHSRGPLGLPEPPVAMITDGSVPADEVLRAAAEAIAGRLRWIQLRRRDDDARSFYLLALRLRELTAHTNTTLIVNDRIDIALACGADGVHLPASGVPCGVARQLLGDGKLVGRSVHGRDEIESAADDPPDYFQFGPVYDTASKREFGPPQGLARLSEAAEAARGTGSGPTGDGVAVVAVGGVRAGRIAAIRAAGAAGVAAIGAFADTGRARNAAAAFIDAL